MNVSCPNCGATYRVDPAKVPATGVRARCTRCGDVMQVGGGAGSGPAAATPDAGRGSAAEDRLDAGAAGAAASAHRSEDAVGASVSREAPGGAPPRQPQPEQQREPAAPAAPQPARQPPAEPAPAAPPHPRPAPAFGAADPDAKARRLARALISDIVVYHPERRDRSLEAGTLRQEFREEIQKSWEEYVAQIGDAAARGTPHFREALNEILAGGRPVF